MHGNNSAPRSQRKDKNGRAETDKANRVSHTDSTDRKRRLVAVLRQNLQRTREPELVAKLSAAIERLQLRRGAAR